MNELHSEKWIFQTTDAEQSNGQLVGTRIMGESYQAWY